MARGRPSTAKGKRRIPTMSRMTGDEEIPEVYREMLAEADMRTGTQKETKDRPIKRRKVGERVPIQQDARQKLAEDSETDARIDTPPRPLQIAIDSDVSASESDMEWEEVDIDPQPFAEDQFPEPDEKDERLEITLNQEPETPRKPTIVRRKPLSAAEKKFRLGIHKFHLLCLLGHVQARNSWCNDQELQSYLRKMLPKQTVALLNPKETMPQANRSTTFIDGLRQASEIFRKRFNITLAGLRRPYWAEDDKSIKNLRNVIIRDFEDFQSIQHFRDRAKAMHGSRDFGAQLFCALLRSAAVETRLVCSLQPLPFLGDTKGNTPMKSKPRYIVISDDHASSSEDRPKTSKSADETPKRLRRITQPRFSSPAIHKAQVNRQAELPQKVPESPHPVFWVEAYNEAVQKWIPVDPLVTQSVARPMKFEPPASDRYNSMSYVVAFEDDASARDVTRRYSKAYNAKTVKRRLESVRDGQQWWQKAIGFFEKPFQEDRDAFELNELTAKTAAEPMPRNIQDFKGHPIYALERHLRRNEVIYPKRASGQVSLGKTGSKSEVEPVYRRSDVHIVRSADGWYRLGRDIKIGEQPLKRVAAIRTGLEEEEEEKDTPLYARYQTEPYQPPPVIQGRIPKNAYGNLDIFVPSMIPPGAFHLKHPDAARAARILEIDYADAVTGFDFKGRRGTAVVQGIVAAEQYREGLEAVIDAIEEARIQEKLDQRAEIALTAWKRFLLKLRIAQQVKKYAVEGEESEEGMQESEHTNDFDDNDAGGGFFHESGQEIAQPTNLSAQDLGDSLPEGTPASKEIAAQLDLDGGFMAESPTAQPDLVTSQAVPSTTLSRPRLFSKSRPRYDLVVVPKDDSQNTRRPFSHIDLTNQRDTSVHESGVPGSSVQAALTIDSSTAKSSSNSVEVVSRPPSLLDSERATFRKTSSSLDSDLEEASLLSHDPEDEDAEPEWLMSD